MLIDGNKEELIIRNLGETKNISDNNRLGLQVLLIDLLGRTNTLLVTDFFKNIPQIDVVTALGYIPEPANQHKYLFGNLYNKFYNQKIGVDQIKWLTFGDSFAQLMYKEIAPKLFSISGNNLSGAYFNGAYRGTTNNSTTGTIIENTTDFQSWVTGLTTTFNTGASRTYGYGAVKANATKIKIYYVIEPGAGTFKVQVNGIDAVGYTNVSANGVLGTLGVVTITQVRTLSDWTVVNLTGTIKIIGTGFEDSTVSGLTTINVSQGGIPLGGTLNSVTGYATAMNNFNSFLADIQPTVMSFEMKENSSYYEEALNTFYSTIDSNLSNTDVLNIGSTPVATNNADQIICNKHLEDISTVFKYNYYNTYSIFGTFNMLTELGWGGDGVHLTAQAHQYRGKLMLEDLDIYSEAEILPDNINNDQIDTKSLNVKSPTGGNLATISAGVSVEATIKSENLSGGSATLNLISGFSAVQGNSYIRATGAELRMFASSVGGVMSKCTIYAGGAERLVALSTGSVGIGVPNPTEKLEILGTYKQYLFSNSDQKNVVQIKDLGASGVTGARNYTIRGVYQYNGGLSSNADGGDLDLIKSLDRNTVLATKTDGTPLGNVGIGITNPLHRLHVEGTTFLNGGLNLPIRTSTAINTIVLISDYTILVDATGGAITTDLPQASTVPNRILNIKKINNTANTVTIKPNGSDLIDFGASIIISTYLQTVRIQSNGIGWFVI